MLVCLIVYYRFFFKREENNSITFYYLWCRRFSALILFEFSYVLCFFSHLVFHAFNFPQVFLGHGEQPNFPHVAEQLTQVQRQSPFWQPVHFQLPVQVEH